MASQSSKRESGRLRDSESGRVLDEFARKRRLRKQLDALEQDNFQDDPHANLQWNKKLPKFDTGDSPAATPTSAAGKKKKKFMRGEHSKLRFRKTFQSLLEEEEANRAESPNYFSAKAPPSKYPARHFCAVCGFYSNYTCTRCGVRYCSLQCRDMHQDTRCLKWTA